MIFTCKTCQSPFEAPPCRKRQYCSPACQKKNPEWRANIGRGGRLSNKFRKEGIEFLFTCKMCGKQFKDFPCKKRSYCSTECMLKDPEIRIKSSISNKLYNEEQLKLPPKFETFTCVTCGKVYQAQILSTSTKRRMYCSRGCQRKVTVGTCLTCGKTFNYDSSAQFGKYCSRQCTTKDPNVTDGISERVTEYWDNWRLMTGKEKGYCYPREFNKALKIRIRERDGGMCIVCGMGEPDHSIVVHHIDHNENNCDEKNLTLLCKSCNCKARYNMTHWTILCNDLLCKMHPELFPEEIKSCIHSTLY